MIFLLLSILSSIGIFWAFRLFKTYSIHTRHGILVNYLVAGITGLIVFRPEQFWFDAPWFWPSAILGVLFYLVFRLMAKVTQENGMSISSITTKMSVIIPVSIGLLLLNESLNLLKIAGITLGLTSILLSARSNVKSNQWIWPLLLFVGSGTVDSCLKLFQHYFVPESSFPMLISNIFLFAFISALIHHLFTQERSVKLNALIGGAGLGVVNFTALYFILKTLALPSWESSLVFPINNFGIIAGSTLLAIVGFRERVTPKGWLGFSLASISILLLYLSK